MRWNWCGFGLALLIGGSQVPALMLCGVLFPPGQRIAGVKGCCARLRMRETWTYQRYVRDNEARITSPLLGRVALGEPGPGSQPAHVLPDINLLPHTHRLGTVWLLQLPAPRFSREPGSPRSLFINLAPSAEMVAPRAPSSPQREPHHVPKNDFHIPLLNPPPHFA